MIVVMQTSPFLPLPFVIVWVPPRANNGRASVLLSMKWMRYIPRTCHHPFASSICSAFVKSRHHVHYTTLARLLFLRLITSAHDRPSPSTHNELNPHILRHIIHHVRTIHHTRHRGSRSRLVWCVSCIPNLAFANPPQPTHNARETQPSSPVTPVTLSVRLPPSPPAPPH